MNFACFESFPVMRKGVTKLYSLLKTHELL